MPDSLAGWLDYIERLHHRPVDMGLERVRAVAERMDLRLDAVKIVVGGTNGKGSTCAMLDAILRAAGYRVGRYGSPHLLAFNERAQIDGLMASDAALIGHFEEVERARGAVTLTYFEFTTLAVLAWFAHEHIDVAVLEVGLGGRLDAVNIVDADCSIVTAIDLDHTELLGATRESIGWEKAHIYRARRPAICADPSAPASLLAYAAQLEADLWCLGRDFSAEAAAAGTGPAQWNYRGAGIRRLALPWPALRGAHQLRNAAGVLAVLEALQQQLPVDQRAVRQGLASVQLAGRFQVIAGRPAIVLDVAHNPHAARALAMAMQSHASAAGPSGSARSPDRARTRAVFGMLRDKDSKAVVQALSGVIDHWHLAPTAGERGLGGKQLQADAFSGDAAPPCTVHDSVAAALDAAQGESGSDDRIAVFGSFVIVADALRWLERRPR